ncbi:MAG: tetratricopeptide repeat protein [Thermoanaerobaculaceae bacterium]
MSGAGLLSLDQLKTAVREGIGAAQRRDYEEAYAVLGEALDAYRTRGEKIPALVLSYYALALGLHANKVKQAIEFCVAAMKAEPTRVDHYVNLAMLYQVAGSRRKAVETIARGLELDGKNPRLLQLKAMIGWRRPPVIPSLSRDHWLNVFLGKVRHTLSPPKHEVILAQGQAKEKKRRV